jgi:hypothetical protein
MKDIKSLIEEAMLDHKENFILLRRKVLKEQYLNLLDIHLETSSIAKSQTHKQIKYLLFYFIIMSHLTIMAVNVQLEM